MKLRRVLGDRLTGIVLHHAGVIVGDLDGSLDAIHFDVAIGEVANIVTAPPRGLNANALPGSCEGHSLHGYIAHAARGLAADGQSVSRPKSAVADDDVGAGHVRIAALDQA